MHKKNNILENNFDIQNIGRLQNVENSLRKNCFVENDPFEEIRTKYYKLFLVRFVAIQLG